MDNLANIKENIKTSSLFEYNANIVLLDFEGSIVHFVSSKSTKSLYVWIDLTISSRGINCSLASSESN